MPTTNQSVIELIAETGLKKIMKNAIMVIDRGAETVRLIQDSNVKPIKLELQNVSSNLSVEIKEENQVNYVIMATKQVVSLVKFNLVMNVMKIQGGNACHYHIV